MNQSVYILRSWFLTTLLLVFSNDAFAAGVGAVFPNYYSTVLELLGIHNHEFVAILGGIMTLISLIAVGRRYKELSMISLQSDESAAPPKRFGIQSMIEGLLDFIYQVASDVIGKNEFIKYLPILFSLFLFIFFSNLSGLVPGFPPPTESINTNLGIALVVFLVYNAAGIKEHGFAYVKQFLGPIWWLAPLMFFIEVVSHVARPLSLSLRLYGNIFGDHLVLSVFSGLTWVVMPAFLLFFGLLVAFVQSFVFTLLTSIYISMAISHDH